MNEDLCLHIYSQKFNELNLGEHILTWTQHNSHEYDITRYKHKIWLNTKKIRAYF